MHTGFWSECMCNGLPKSHWVSNRTWSTEGLWAPRDPPQPKLNPRWWVLMQWQHKLQPLTGTSSDTHSAMPGAKEQISICDFLFVLLPLPWSSFINCYLLNRCLEKDKAQHIPVKLLLKSMRGQDLLGGGKQLLKRAAQTDVQVHQWANQAPACLEMINKWCTGYQELFHPCNLLHTAACGPPGTPASLEHRRTSIMVNDFWWKSCLATHGSCEAC